MTWDVTVCMGLSHAYTMLFWLIVVTAAVFNAPLQAKRRIRTRTCRGLSSLYFGFPWDYTNISNKTATMSPFTIIFKQFGSMTATSFMNTAILSPLISAGNHALLAGTRMLYGLVTASHALWPCHSVACPIPLRMDNVWRCTTSSTAPDEQFQLAMLQQFFRRKQPAMGMGAESSVVDVAIVFVVCIIHSGQDQREAKNSMEYITKDIHSAKSTQARIEPSYKNNCNPRKPLPSSEGRGFANRRERLPKVSRVSNTLNSEVLWRLRKAHRQPETEQLNQLPKSVDDFSGLPNSEVLLSQLLPKGEELEVDDDDDVPNENVDFNSSEVAGTGLVFEGADRKLKGEEQGTLSAHLPSWCLASTASNSMNFARHDKSIK
ncbi:hypothetical protein EI94DRAFT_1704948 [Lactarius quietus]|nr:hypothetical protein EI94DRAFT_1704948 [Lactarius quietus]